MIGDIIRVNRCADRAIHPDEVQPAGTVHCSRCKEECWVAPNTVELMKRRPDMEPVCAVCLQAEDVSRHLVVRVPKSGDPGDVLIPFTHAAADLVVYAQSIGMKLEQLIALLSEAWRYSTELEAEEAAESKERES